MNKIKLIGLVTLTGLLVQLGQAQTVSDALRYSDFNYSGTARFMATGGALGPLGADISVVSTNPAGIGFFRRSEFTLTTAFFINNTDSRLTNEDRISVIEDERINMNFHNLGAVITSRPLSKKWKNVNFGITFNNIANFNRAFTFQGRSMGSITEAWQERANGSVGLTGFDTDLALQAGAIYDFNEDGIYDIDYELNREAPLFREQQVVEEGSMGEMAFTLAGNYDDKLAIGLTVGVPIVDYSYKKTYTEQDDNEGPGGAVPYFESLEFEERLRTTGTGINAKLGLIFRLHQAFRLGASIHTPTAFSLEDSFEGALVNNFYEDENEQGAFLGTEAFSEGLFDYKLRTPWRYTGGVGFIFGKNGFLTAEVEFVDFTDAAFSYDGFITAEAEVNRDIGNQLTDRVNVRLGGEVVIDDFRFRLGYNIRSTPFQNDETNRNQFSAGLGYRSEGFFVDLAYRRSMYEEFYYPYITEEYPIQEVLNEYTLGQVGVTIGAKF